jgi:23S rRNA (uridine2552-2'-O)-methyltransferase
MSSTQRPKFPSSRAQSVRLVKKRGRKVSSQRWLERHLNDPYVQEAKKQGWRSRAAFKILQVQERYGLFKPGQCVVDLGCAPGGWSQVVAELIAADKGQGVLIGTDLLLTDPIPGMIFIQGDFLDPNVKAQVDGHVQGPLDVVLSDMAASTTGHSDTDHWRTQQLVEAAFFFARRHLREGGSLVAKVFVGGTHQDLLQDLKRAFKTVKHFKPPASRKESPEMYVICQGFKPDLPL